MPRNKLDIRAFSAGLFTNGDPVDIPPGASEYHLNIDPNAPEGILRGRPDDLDLASKWVTIDPPAGMDSATMIQRGNGKVTLVTTGGQQASPGFSPIGGSPSPSQINVYEDFYLPTGPAGIKSYPVSSVENPDVAKSGESIRLACGRSPVSPPMYVGYPKHSQFLTQPSDEIIVEKAELTPPAAGGKAFRAVFDATYVYYIVYNDSTVYRLHRTNGTLTRLEAGFVVKTKAICWDPNEVTTLLIMDQHDATGRVRRIPIAAFNDSTTTVSTLTLGAYSLCPDDIAGKFEWTDIVCTKDFVWLAGYQWGEDRPSAEPWRVPYVFSGTAQTMTNVAPFHREGTVETTGSTLPEGVFFTKANITTNQTGWTYKIARRGNYAKGVIFPLSVMDTTLNAIWFRYTPLTGESFNERSTYLYGVSQAYPPNENQIVRLNNPNIFVLLKGSSVYDAAGYISYNLNVTPIYTGAALYQKRYFTVGYDSSRFFMTGTDTYDADQGGSRDFHVHFSFPYSFAFLLYVGSTRASAYTISGIYYHGVKTKMRRTMILSALYTNTAAWNDPYPVVLALSSPQDGVAFIRTFRADAANDPTVTNVQPPELLTMTIEDETNEGKFLLDHRYYFRYAVGFDGYQMSPMGLQYAHVPLADGRQVKVTLTIGGRSRLSKRISGVYVFMSQSTEASSEPTELFSMVRYIPLDNSWSTVSEDVLKFEFFMIDPDEIEQTYEAMTGINEVLATNFVYYELAAVAAGYLFTGRCWHPELDDASQYVFRSRAGRFDMFDWSKDFLVLPEIPIAMAEYDGGLWVFSRTTAYRIDPVEFVVTDIIPNIGALGSRSVKPTRQGLVVCGNTDIWILQAKEWKNASLSIRGMVSAAWGTMAHNDFPPIVTESDLYGVQILADSHDARYVYVLAQNGSWWHWKLEEGENDGPAAVFEGVYGENYYVNSTSTYQIAGNPTTRKWFSWTSLRHPGSSPSLRKKLYFVRWTPQQLNGMTIQYRTSEWDWQTLGQTGETDMSKITGTWFQTRIVPNDAGLDPGITTREIQTVTFIYRELEGLR